MGHAILSASGAARWLACPPSAREEQKYPSESSPYAREGTRAHALAEKHLKRYLETGDATVTFEEDAGMAESVQSYVDTVVEKITEARTASKDAQIFIEKKLDFSQWVPHGFGTGDAVILSDAFLEIIDLKYGKGVPVSAKNNPQMRLYALGMYALMGWLYSAENVRMTIVQPRLDSISTETITVKELLAWGESIKDIADKAFQGEGEYKAGDHCRFCRARKVCRTRANALKKVYRKACAPGNELEPEEIAEIVLQAKNVQTWLDEVKEYARVKAISGEKWPGLKLVQGRSVRKIINKEDAGELLVSEGFPRDKIFKTQLCTITELEKVCGRKKLKELLQDQHGYIIKPKGEPTLVSSDDKREEIQNIKDLFEEESQ